MFIEVLILFASSLIIGYSGALMPGPVLIVTINESTKRGLRSGLSVSLGHILLEVIMVFLLTIGLAEVLSLPPIVASIGFFGGLFLSWMAYTILRDALRRKVSLNPDLKLEDQSMGSTMLGVYTSLSNPFWFIWWISVGAVFLLKALEFSIVGVMAFYFGHILSDLSWYGLVAFVMVRGKKFMSDRVYRSLLIFCGATLIFFSIVFIKFGLDALL
ncbi:MAG: LysE family translocator [Candidatus Methylarchaceae archaeon HK01B]|nr:LysE family translocator [Candidatus Methylarchaceae archaeon HK01M]MCP8311556.1 LysE family translocator [Candidatus Methylarchaceae archaeon HK02M1]MCP8319244.1 LysE family translocator [Candidatus Methylarchaceae archaeon HK01B]